jgi:hypothetical protein
MKKYKLIKEYPDSPKLETIVEVEKDGYIYWNVNSNKNNPTKYIHNSSIKQYKEFWQEVVEKDYEILSFDKGSIEIDKNNLWLSFRTNGTDTRIDENKMIERGHLIHSVKRLSDGEI